MKYVTVREAMALLGISRQAIHALIKNKRIKSTVLPNRRHHILFDDLDMYVKTKWNRQETTKINGVKVFGGDNVSPKEAAELINIGLMSIYYAMRHGFIKSKLVGCSYVLSKKEILEFGQSETLKRMKEANRLAV
jgi:excisionase family DNA binding protein